MAARYAATRRLVGELSFHVTARRFISSEPPIAPVPSNFGDNFPRFIRGLGNAACVEYVADVAELEMQLHKARRAPHTQPLTALALSFLPVERLIGLCVVLNPSAWLVQSRFPIVTAWENNKTNKDSRMIERWVAEDALVARPLLEVEVRRIPLGGYAFLRALSEGKTVATAIRIATETAPKFDIRSTLELIDDAKVVAEIQEGS